MWRWFKWVLLGIGIIIVGIGIVLYSYYFIWMKMKSGMRANAKTAFASGITVTDASNDFVLLGTDKEDPNSTDTNNPSPYKVDYLDIKSVQFGADDKYIYYKATFYDTIPKWPEDINGDRLIAIGLKLHIVDQKGDDQIVLHSDFGWEPVIKLPALNTSYDYCPTGIEWPENARMSCHGDDSKIYGGGGTDYIMGALPLEKIGLKTGQTIYLTFDEETKSQQFTHAAFDVLQGSEKMAGTITWKIGSNQYQINNSGKYQN